MDWLDDHVLRTNVRSSGFAQHALTFLATAVLACGGIEPGTGTDATTASTGGATDAPATEPDATVGGAETGVPASCECFDSPMGIAFDDCAAGTDCGGYEELPTDEWECNDGTEGPDIDDVANAAVVQCILDAAAAAQPFQFRLEISFGQPSNCTNRYYAFPSGELHVVESEQNDLCFTDVASIKSAFDLTACAGMSGAEGWACIEAAIASATADGTCWEDSHCEG